MVCSASVAFALLALVQTASGTPQHKLDDAQCLPRAALAAAFGTYEDGTPSGISCSSANLPPAHAAVCETTNYGAIDSWLQNAGWSVRGKWKNVGFSASAEAVLTASTVSVDVIQLFGMDRELPGGSTVTDCILGFEGTDDEHASTSTRKYKLQEQTRVTLGNRSYQVACETPPPYHPARH